MLGGYALKWLGLVIIIVGFFMLVGGLFGGGAALGWSGFIALFVGGFCRYVSKQSTRTTN
jgi:membrane protein implicated in regulation of membrane protease activity